MLSSYWNINQTKTKGYSKALLGFSVSSYRATNTANSRTVVMDIGGDVYRPQRYYVYTVAYASGYG